MARTRRNRGLTLTELLVAAVILTVCAMGLMSAWVFAFAVTRGSDETAGAYSLARRVVEEERAAGYLYGAPSDQWYDASQQPVSTSSGARYRVRARITPGAEDGVPDHLQIKQVDVTVARAEDGAILCRTSTYLAMGGV